MTMTKRQTCCLWLCLLVGSASSFTIVPRSTATATAAGRTTSGRTTTTLRRTGPLFYQNNTDCTTDQILVDQTSTPDAAPETQAPAVEDLLQIRRLLQRMIGVSDDDNDDDSTNDQGNPAGVLGLVQSVVLDEPTDQADQLDQQQDVVTTTKAASSSSTSSTSSSTASFFWNPIQFVSKIVLSILVPYESATQSVTGAILAMIDILGQLDTLTNETSKLEYATYPIHKEYPDVPLSSAMKMVDGVPPVDYWFSTTKIWRSAKRLLRVLLGLSFTQQRAFSTNNPAAAFGKFFTKSTWLWIFDNPFDLVPQPAQYTLEHWDDDAEFARQFMNGVNPVMLRVVREPADELLPELYQTLGRTFALDNLAEDGRLFTVDYRSLGELPTADQAAQVHNPHQAYPAVYNPDMPQDDPRYFQVPQVVFRHDGQGGLRVLGIQLWRNETTATDGDSNKVYMPDGSPEWLYAKMCVANCDSQFHEWVSHLGQTHLTIEGHIVAIHNTLRQATPEHPIYVFLRPICRDTLLLNYLARIILADFGPQTFGDRQSSVGVGQFFQLVGKYWDGYDFFKSSAFDEELASRGFDETVELEDYLFRRDGMELWTAWGKFATEYVNEFYDSDKAVQSDRVLQEWAKETSSMDRAAIKGFPKKFTSRALLARTLQTLCWVCSGLHAAVNFPQYDFYAYAPNKPLSMRAGPAQFEAAQKEKSPAELRDWIFAEACSSLPDTMEEIAMVHLLTMPSKNTIINLDENFEQCGKETYQRFKQDLTRIGNTINERNQRNRAKGRPVYHYLHPKVVPAAIDI